MAMLPDNGCIRSIDTVQDMLMASLCTGFNCFGVFLPLSAASVTPPSNIVEAPSLLMPCIDDMLDEALELVDKTKMLWYKSFKK